MEKHNFLPGKIEVIQKRIFTVRGQQVIFDKDLADMYQVGTKVLNQAVKRNRERFPTAFRFQLTNDEDKSLRSQNVTLEDNRGKHRKYLPYAFSEQCVAMLSSVLRSDVAVKVSVQIMQAFVQMRKFITTNATLFQRLDTIELKQLKADQKFDQLFKALEN